MSFFRAFKAFDRATVTITRTTAGRSVGADGTDTDMVISSRRCDPQQESRRLERYEDADMLLFCSWDVSAVETGDEATVNFGNWSGHGEAQGTVTAVEATNRVLALDLTDETAGR
jgi:hypothetical protein